MEELPRIDQRIQHIIFQFVLSKTCLYGANEPDSLSLTVIFEDSREG